MAASTADVAIIGAGASGLAAASALHSCNLDCVVLEARERIGGRILTIHDGALPVPIELGAEFVHGEAPELADLAREAKLATCDIAGQRWVSTRGRLRPLPDFWEQLDRVMRLLGASGKADRSFQDFLDRRPGGARLASERALARGYVEGFHAADPRRVSARALAEGGSPRGDTRERRIGRVLGGYDLVTEWLARGLSDRIRLGAIVSEIRWAAGEVEISTRAPDGSSPSPIHAQAAIITVPLGVLQAPAGEAGAIAFHPPLVRDRAKREALSTMAMGCVVRVVLGTIDRFWAAERFARHARSAALDELSFLQSDDADADFPIWWTAYPIRAPLVVGWRGGPRAKTLADCGHEDIVQRAARSLGKAFGSARVAGEVQAGWTHDWVNDPFARGAYSYMLVGGSSSPAKLARPLRRTLFFAGEASEAEGRTGTVHGAIASGRRAAREVGRALGVTIRS